MRNGADWASMVVAGAPKASARKEKGDQMKGKIKGSMRSVRQLIERASSKAPYVEKTRDAMRR